MRNSFSLLVCFPLVLQCDVNIISKTFTASGKMKLISLTIMAISLTVDAAHEYYTYPLQFQTPIPGVLSSQSSVYLPPQSHTLLPYFPIKNVDKLRYPYLPATGTKTPVGIPSHFPIIVSSTLLPPLDNDEDESDGQDILTSSPPSFLRDKDNPTERNHIMKKAERKQIRPMINTQKYQQPIDRIDMRVPQQFTMKNGPSSPNLVNHTPSARNMIISAETRNDHGIDQEKAANFHIPQYIPYPAITISSTTETAVPILRLSNEMDLDGSFSYEALGADQTHYVQHSRTENYGTDKQEQIVEGSYSYVGDNGQTYTVHYVADSNGFRASGDHLPVAPPVPEIIQRSVQYNLAEEAKKPPHLKSWNEERENELGDSGKSHYFANSPPHNLFTGRTPESFSYSFSQGLNNLNNFATAGDSQTPTNTNIEFTPEQMKVKATATISPQITFLASHGAHVPSVSTPQHSIARMFTTEKSTMPQLINYEADIRESDQANNKALWRWQYGMNIDSNQTPEKNTISRSFGEGDDVMINFDDMTPEQYTSMIRSQLEPRLQEQIDTSNNNQFDFPNMNDEYHYQNNIDKVVNSVINEEKLTSLSTESVIESTQPDNRYKTFIVHNNNQNIQQINSNSKPLETNNIRSSHSSKLITQNEFIPRTQTVTQSYDYENGFYVPRRIKTLNPDASVLNNLNVIPPIHSNKTNNNYGSNTNNIKNVQKVSQEPYMSSTINTVQFTDFNVNTNKNDFKPIINKLTKPDSANVTATDTSVEDVLKNNIFLKNLFKSDKNNLNKMSDEGNIIFLHKETRPEKSLNLFQKPPQPINEVKGSENHPSDLSEILNYISSKSTFESNKINTRNNPRFNNFHQRNEVRFIPVQQDRNEKEPDNRPEENNKTNMRNYEQLEELRGIIKNYKVLQRNNSVNKDKDVDKIKRDLSPPSIKTLHLPNLPPLGRAGPSMKSYLPPVYV